MALANHTIFISGASRGIGKAIALKCAKDGANIVVAAKTAEPHPKLPGTIYTAAQEIEDAGGKALPCIVDIRSETAVRDAVNQAKEKFGKIDILINNASAISLTPSETTGMKQYDLMNSINARGTYLCSHVCISDILKSAQENRQAHILNISPPLSMNPIWFKNHTAYTMAKYGMSMCVLGMAGEFQDRGVAVNALWPRTGIWTAAMKMLGGGTDDAAKGCRTEAIMADAAYQVLISDPKIANNTGNFYIDEEVLRQRLKMTDFSQYDCVPGAELMPDFFIDEYEQRFKDTNPKNVFGSKEEKKSEAPSTGTAKTIQDVFSNMTILLASNSAAYIKKADAVYHFYIKDTKEDYFLDLKNENGNCGSYDPSKNDIKITCKFDMKEKDFIKMFNGKLNPTMAFMSGKLKMSGDLKKAMALENVMKDMNK